MHEAPDIICPDCGARHGPAAKACECGRSLVVEEAPASPLIYFVIAIVAAVGTALSSNAAEKLGLLYFPFGGILFASVAFTLGVRSWLWGLRNRDKH
ncbi:hypothetical protein [Roseimicrobium sp. ORNL1]|uniref:hypothetical protein n=1 Tax=Roseimicrobium sp. ORNL1 TaxID=2711231 RepID=UPI0013E19283|nr:hypothetical protein [Roseimicrobium sp. ORNL1]QIF03785.1 hypothetical protein G5S37_20420 [Roseimicrobium sp. ORNL1]